jgi:hypothetical protein
MVMPVEKRLAGILGWTLVAGTLVVAVLAIGWMV